MLKAPKRFKFDTHVQTVTGNMRAEHQVRQSHLNALKLLFCKDSLGREY